MPRKTTESRRSCRAYCHRMEENLHPRKQFFGHRHAAVTRGRRIANQAGKRRKSARTGSAVRIPSISCARNPSQQSCIKAIDVQEPDAGASNRIGRVALTVVAAAIGAIASVRRPPSAGIAPGKPPPARASLNPSGVLYPDRGGGVPESGGKVGSVSRTPPRPPFLVRLVANALWSWLFFAWHRGALASGRFIFCRSMSRHRRRSRGKQVQWWLRAVSRISPGCHLPIPSSTKPCGFIRPHF